jgi:hypothetical protein
MQHPSLVLGYEPEQRDSIHSRSQFALLNPQSLAHLENESPSAISRQPVRVRGLNSPDRESSKHRENDHHENRDQLDI